MFARKRCLPEGGVPEGGDVSAPPRGERAGEITKESECDVRKSIKRVQSNQMSKSCSKPAALVTPTRRSPLRVCSFSSLRENPIPVSMRKEITEDKWELEKTSSQQERSDKKFLRDVENWEHSQTK